MNLKKDIETVLARLPQETLAEDAKNNKFTMIKSAMVLASRDYAGKRNWLIIENQTGRSMVLTGTLYDQFNLEMMFFWFDTNGERIKLGKEMAFRGTREQAVVAHDNVIFKFFKLFEEQNNFSVFFSFDEIG